jgi:hypothetical protein
MVLANLLYVVVAFILLGRKLVTLEDVKSELPVPCPVEEGAF